MEELNLEGYFSLSDAEKLKIQQMLYVYAHKIMRGINNKRGPRVPETNIYDVCNFIMEQWIEAEEFEMVQAMKDTITNYDFKRPVDN